jgi:arginine deiminase
MNAEIKSTQAMVLAIYHAQRQVLAEQPTRDLNDLLQECDDLRFDQTFSVRTAAEINRTACVSILEARNVKLCEGSGQ